MCSIVGVRHDNDERALPALVEMMEATAHRGPDGASVADLDDHHTAPTLEALERPDREATWGMGHLRLAITGDVGVQPMRDCEHRFVVAFNGEVWNHEALRERLEPRHTMEQDSDADVLPHLIEEHLPDEAAGDRPALVEALDGALDDIDGEYAIAAMDGEVAVLVRDPLGVKPLYYAHEGDTFAFASEQKALWARGFDAERVPPNTLVALDADGVRAYPRDEVLDAEGHDLGDRERAFATYEASLERAIAKRVHGTDEVAVVFSGGVDSALVAAGAQRLGANVTCYVAGRPGSSDVEAARAAAEEMGLELRVASLEDERVATWLPDVLEAVESRNQLHVETALPLFAVCRLIAEDGTRVLLTGQGADELFAGYRWYPRVLEVDGPEGLRGRMREDRDLLYKETLEREDRITMHHSLELRVPFLDPEVVAVAERIPLDLLVEGPDDVQGKRLHRRVAEAWGVPASIAWREKEAAQHGSGSRNTLLAAARSFGLGPAPTGYEAAASVPGRVGSSQRYGHAYTDEPDAWDLDDELQWTLDQLSARGTLSPSDRARLAAAAPSAPTPP